MSDVVIPKFGELLADHLGGVEAGALPFLLSQLERTAAERYRGWAEAVPEHRDGLLACAASEDEIADRVEQLFPPTEAQRASVLAMIGEARDAYYAAFDGYGPVEQMTIQANAERQGAGAWQSLKNTYPDHSDALDALSQLESTSADYLDKTLKLLHH